MAPRKKAAGPGKPRGGKRQAADEQPAPQVTTAEPAVDEQPTEQLAAQDDRPKADLDLEGKPPPIDDDPPPAVPPPVLTAEQRAQLAAATPERLREVLASSDLPDEWRQEFQAELDRKEAAAQLAAQQAAKRTEINRYRITKGGRFSQAGHITQLRVGGVVSDLTHNLDELRRQGIEFEPFTGDVVVERDQLNRAVTQLRVR